MKIEEAKLLVQSAFSENQNPEIWMDLGCGSGTFTYALSEFLAEKSQIYAIDSLAQNLRSYPEKVIHFVKSDFENDEILTPMLHGILMANWLHYVLDKEKLISKLLRNLKQNGTFLIIEYETEHQNQWVPFPIKRKNWQNYS